MISFGQLAKGCHDFLGSLDIPSLRPGTQHLPEPLLRRRLIGADSLTTLPLFIIPVLNPINPAGEFAQGKAALFTDFLFQAVPPFALRAFQQQTHPSLLSANDVPRPPRPRAEAGGFSSSPTPRRPPPWGSPPATPPTAAGSDHATFAKLSAHLCSCLQYSKPRENLSVVTQCASNFAKTG